MKACSPGLNVSVCETWKSWEWIHRNDCIPLGMQDVSYDERSRVSAWHMFWANFLHPWRDAIFLLCPTQDRSEQCSDSILGYMPSSLSGCFQKIVLIVCALDNWSNWCITTRHRTNRTYKIHRTTKTSHLSCIGPVCPCRVVMRQYFRSGSFYFLQQKEQLKRPRAKAPRRRPRSLKATS